MTPEQVIVARRAYSPNGKEAWVEDARGNRTTYAYDGFDRLATTTFPDAAYTYDPLGWRVRCNVNEHCALVATCEVEERHLHVGPPFH